MISRTSSRVECGQAPPALLRVRRLAQFTCLAGPIRARQRPGENAAAPGIVKPVATPASRRRHFSDFACYNPPMAKHPPKKHSGRRGDPVSLYPLTMDQAVDAIFAIKPKDVRKILAKRPGKGKKA